MKKPRYGIYDTYRREYLETLITIRGDDGESVIVGMRGTKDPERALLCVSAKAARNLIRRMGGGAEWKVKNARGEIME